MRLLLVMQQLRRPAPGGIGTYARGLVSGLAALGSDGDGPQVSLLASRAPGRPGSTGVDPLCELGPPVVTSPAPGRVLPLAWLAGLARAPGGFDVVHATSLAAPPVRGAHLGVTVHDLAWRQLPETFPRWGRRWHDAALSVALRRAQLLVVDGPATAAALDDAGAREGQVAVVDPMRGCDHLPAPDEEDAAALLGRLGVDGPYLLSVGTIEPRKNLARLLQAYRLARDELPEPWPLVLVGPRGWDTPPDATAGVVFAGEVVPGVLSALYRGARCVAYVPLAEGFGLPAAEAMASGVPVVASPIPSTAGAALEVDPLDVASIADGLVRAATEEGLREGLVAAGLARAGQLTWKEVARRHLEVWEKLA